MKREIVFDTETTGLKPEDGERIIEIGAVEMENGFPTGRIFHTYINPDGRQVHPEAEKVHGISNADLVGKPLFAQVAGDFITFIGDSMLVAHNAFFDLGFINAELKRLNLDLVPRERIVDTLAIARRKHPMGPNSLDALCARYGIDNSHRTRHGALLDAELLAEVYIEMNGGRQASMSLDRSATDSKGDVLPEFAPMQTLQRPRPLAPRLSDEDVARHEAFVATLGEKAVWKRYDG